MDRAGRVPRIWLICLLALVLSCATLAGCGGPPSTGAVTGTVYFSGHVTRTVLALDATVVAWQGGRRVAESPLQRRRGWVSFAPGSGAAAVGTYRLNLAPGRVVLEVGDAPPAGETGENAVVIRAGTTARRDLHVVFHAPPTAR